ncbi:MAG: hypothetical protein F6K36_13845 [Symploca sp. SIO3C6]|uniref:Uncharacterized protein n=1 Tax=Symploca sp. SIO1C4 TaxID=2607765 RepID=A0A6B3N8U6_9CYAN|nr:hypothetical protein [Symploca sp. SIO3C6]NER30036.1 hypothetical protein [Symploca sp. SIO1C4]
MFASTSPSSKSNFASLAALWARKYYLAVTTKDEESELNNTDKFKDVSSPANRKLTAEKLMYNLNLASAQAWSLTEKLLSKDIQRHGINLDLIHPLEIAADTRYLFQTVLDAYARQETPQRLSVIVGKDFGRVRQKYTSIDRRAIGFVSMQFHYTGQKLLEWLLPREQLLWTSYLKVMDDHMYMPLQAAYEAAGNHSYNSPALIAVRQLLPLSSQIAYSVCKQVRQSFPNYRTYSGPLSELKVRTSSIRDVEMFQVYLCLCVLDQEISSVQRELFPLCVLLYPRLQVSWRLVQEMLRVMGWEMHQCLLPENMATFLPYLRTLTEMFSFEVFQKD